MQYYQKFLEKHSLQFLIFAILWVIIGSGILWYRRQKRGFVFPKLSADEILFQETTASGNSYKTWHTRLGGANNCLKLVITKDELWITTWFPFTLVADMYDLEHRIPRNKIQSIKKTKVLGRDRLIIDFITSTGTPRKIGITPKALDRFLTTIDPHEHLQKNG
jgi:hypothetical protein